MRKSPVAPVVAALAWTVFVACSSSSANPPQLGPCEVGGAACPVPLLSGGVSGDHDAAVGSNTCVATAGDGQCTQCADTSCCAAFEACTASTDCENLLRCEQSCAGVACVSSCQSQSPKGEPLLNTLESCIEARCPVCRELGTGDACSAQGGACNPGLSCSGLWCTKSCARSTDCAGLGAGGGNAIGLPNACIVTGPAAEECVPGCAADADCTAFPGSFCFATTSSDGLSVRVCAPPPDAGAD